MTASRKTKLLVILCFITIGTLALIQYYLVRNTYNLTKEKYYREVRSEIANITNTALYGKIEELAQESLKYIARLYVAGKLPRELFVKNLAQRNDSLLQPLRQRLVRHIAMQPTLKNVRFKSQYDQIVISYYGRSDTLLSEQSEPYVFLGARSGLTSALLMSNGGNVIVDNLQPGNETDLPQSIKLQILHSEYADVSSWKAEVWKRMTGIYVLAISLLIAVISLYYFILRAMLRQKKLAEIKTDFANNITHELKTPLASVGIILKSLEKADVRANSKATDDLIVFLQRQYEKIKQVVDVVLESSMTVPDEIKKEQLDISAYLNEYVKEVRMDKHVFDSSVTPTHCLLRTNEPLLYKILNNLLDNAAKYSPEGSKIFLKGNVSGKKYCIEVEDEGDGIPDRDRPFIFDKFFRVPTQNRHNVKGLGLGLYLSKQAADAMGAKLSLKSRQGRGTIFTLELKL